MQGFGVAADHMDLVLAALWQHFRRRQRWQAAADFFRELMQVGPHFLGYIREGRPHRLATRTSSHSHLGA